MQNIFQAIKATVAEPAVYPEVPATWPNRAVRRAVRGNRESRLPGEWRGFLAMHPDYRTAIQRSRLVA